LPPKVDGRSLAPLLYSKKVDGWRSVALIEHRGPVRDSADPDRPVVRGGNPTTYEAIRTATFLYVEYADDEREYRSLATDPDEVHNTYRSLSSEEKEPLHKTLTRVEVCHGTQDCLAAEHVAQSLLRSDRRIDRADVPRQLEEAQ
jgi:N-acetylglucosamine-6-sulfatase